MLQQWYCVNMHPLHINGNKHNGRLWQFIFSAIELEVWSIFGYEWDTVMVFSVNLDDSVFLDGIKGCLRRIDKQAYPDIAWYSRLIYHHQASLTPARVLGKSIANITEGLTLSLRMKAACPWYSKHLYTAGNIFWKNYRKIALRGRWKKQVLEVGCFHLLQSTCLHAGMETWKPRTGTSWLDQYMAIKSWKA